MKSNDSPLVSVIIPVYNVEKYLARCLNSVVGQTYQNLEIILVNDGSTDRSGEICRQYAQNDPRIRLFTQENRGVSVARNTGLDHAKGDYIVFVDSDDYISPCAVEMLLRQLLKYRVPIAACNFLIAEAEDDHAPLDMAAADGSYSCQRMTRDEVFDTMGTDFGSRFLNVWGKIYEKRIYESLRYEAGKIYEDALIYHEIYAQVSWVCYVDLKLYAYRTSPNSITRRNGTDYRIVVILAEMWLKRLEFFQQYGKRKYIRRAEKRLFSELATYLPNDLPGEQGKQLIKETEAKVYQITGKKFVSWKWALFKSSPKAYLFAKNFYLRLRDLIRALNHKKSA